MGELTVDNVIEAYPRLEDVDEDEIQRRLNAALASARAYCGWMVSPVATAVVVTLDGPCGRVLDLPTRKLNALTAVTEDGNALVVSDLNWSTNGSVRKKSGASWSCNYGSIAVTMTHGYTEAQAADWRQAILSMVNEISSVTAGDSTAGGALIRKRVDDVEYQWSGSAIAQSADRAVYLASEVLDRYRLMPVYFA